MRRVNDQLAALFDHWTKAITGFAANPKIVVMLIKLSDDSLVLAPGVFNVDLAAHGRPRGRNDSRKSPANSACVINSSAVSRVITEVKR